ncbi:MAG: hypothetical protein SCALA702_08880 [Melioribacteraceae bacterium]|nr:MAG: hypothetical protein SCALA702_08880 [Melioribacteraceae bacterium]
MKIKNIKTYLVNFVLTSIFIAILLGGCKDTINEADLFIPSVNVSYNQHIQPVFNIYCNYSGCHNTEDAAGGLMLTSWAGTTSNVSIVFPGDPDNSILIWAIRGNNGAKNMPPLGYQPLTEDQIIGIEAWVAEGAKAN